MVEEEIIKAVFEAVRFKFSEQRINRRQMNKPPPPENKSRFLLLSFKKTETQEIV